LRIHTGIKEGKVEVEIKKKRTKYFQKWKRQAGNKERKVKKERK
jgi:hypothetical protein